MWNETVLAQFAALYRDLPGGTKENHDKRVRIASIRVEIGNGNLQNMNLDNNIRSDEHVQEC
jgi:hypothetical protein